MIEWLSSIAEAFVLNVERAPGKPCLRFEGEERTYQKLRGHAETFAAALAVCGRVSVLRSFSGSISISWWLTSARA